ncbi:hypothetical protein RchiOBHm_Chr6g0247021 [Rosa chinensis]|uniref:Uncharacterized protein n=1 Tax=Rosa chinensis TaxID=74649 RepID=A0A2P6PJM9_ROSCH|nr:hypothetical protein RchiOBHm_Chr6g0247021 [Rosa chinensis]
MKYRFCPCCLRQLQVCHSSTPFLRDGFCFSLTVVVFHNRNHLPELIISSSRSIPSDSVEEEVEAVLYESRVCEIQIGGEKSVSYRSFVADKLWTCVCQERGRVLIIIHNDSTNRVTYKSPKVEGSLNPQSHKLP